MSGGFHARRVISGRRTLNRLKVWKRADNAGGLDADGRDLTDEFEDVEGFVGAVEVVCDVAAGGLWRLDTGQLSITARSVCRDDTRTPLP